MLMNLKSNSKVGKAITETASIAYDGALLPTGTASYGGISINATKRYLKNSGKDKTPALVESGQGKFFNGTSQYINTGIIPNQSQGTLVTRFTYASGTVNRTIIGKYDGAFQRITIDIGATGKISASFADKINTDIEHNLVLINGMSYHVALRYTGTAYQLLVDGIQVLSGTAGGLLSVGTISLFLGARNNNGVADRYFNNVIDETYYYDVALPDSAIQSLYLYPERVKSYNGAIVPDIGYEANCKLFLPLCENSGSNVYNVAVNHATALALTNYTTAMHTSASKLSYGAQCTAWKRDSLGVLLGMSNGLSFDGGKSTKGINTGWMPSSAQPYVVEAVVKIEQGVLNQMFGTAYLANSTTAIGFSSTSLPQGAIADKYIINGIASTIAHVVINWNGIVGQSKIYINGIEISYVKETSYVNPVTNFFIGSLGATQKTMFTTTPKIHKGTQYAKFNIDKSWKAAQKIIAKLGA